MYYSRCEKQRLDGQAGSARSQQVRGEDQLLKGPARLCRWRWCQVSLARGDPPAESTSRQPRGDNMLRCCLATLCGVVNRTKRRFLAGDFYLFFSAGFAVEMTGEVGQTTVLRNAGIN